MRTLLSFIAVSLAFCTFSLAQDAPQRNVYFGDTHLHTSYSPDAYLMENRSADPDTAYRYAKGEPVIHPYNKAKIQIHTPLDFLVVSDHSEYMGVIPMLFAGDPRVANTEFGKRFVRLSNEGKHAEAFGELILSVNNNTAVEEINTPEIRESVWNDIMDAAERHNEPGKFTSFLGWEWSSTPNGANLHRIVFLKDGKDVGTKLMPYTSFDSDKPEDLWNWLAKTSKSLNAEMLAIPHNSNISKGLMFQTVDSDGKPITAEYAKLRMAWEPVVEVTQIKGDSETNPRLSPNDEFADYETYEHFIEVQDEGVAMFDDSNLGDTKAIEPDIEVSKGDYIRSALKRGLEIENKTGANPYKFGLVGSTDSHTAMSSAEEDNFWGKMAIDSTPGTKEVEIIPGANGYDMGAAGLAGVWAEENTRASLFDAFRRKEVFATTGPRIIVRVFGGWDFTEEDTKVKDLATVGYKKGVPMGSDLTKAPQGKAPSFLIKAVKDPKGANLDRIQVVKGWLDKDGNAQEKVYDVAWSGDRKPGADGKVPAVGSTVDLKTASYNNSIGTPLLVTSWTDPEFEASERAFYYIRALQIPTPRNSLYDAVALQIDPKETGHPATIQERAYTSPIWYTPSE